MGMFDDLIWNYPLEGMPLGTMFQTKDLGEGLREYEVNAEGRLMLLTYQAFERLANGKIIPWVISLDEGYLKTGDYFRELEASTDTNYHGDLVIYTSDFGDWREYTPSTTDFEHQNHSYL